jgi:histidyl-tRNA synthetase
MVAARAAALKKPLRWFSIPQLFRYERQQRGRLREHFQLNMDLIGEESALADAEIIAAALDIMRALGLGPETVRVRVSDRRVMQALVRSCGIADQHVGAAYAQIDKMAREPRDVLVRRLREATGVGADVADRVLAIGGLRGLDAVEEAAGASSGGDVTRDLRRCVDALTAMGLGAFVEVDLSIVRGLAYYTGIVFELFDASGSLRAICGGGRYDDLLAALGGVDLPAVGFGMGDVVLAELLREQGSLGAGAESAVDVFLVAVGGGDIPAVLRLAHDLRDRGIRTEFALREQAVGKQLKLAAARGARFAVVIGPDERKADAAALRELETGKEQRVALGSLAEAIRSAADGGRHG